MDTPGAFFGPDGLYRQKRFEKMGRVKKLLSNTAIFAAGTFLSKVLVYFLMPLYTSILSPEESSVADFIQQTGNLLMPLFAIGICDGLLRFAMDAGERKREIFSTSVMLLTAGSLLCVLSLPLYYTGEWADGLFGGQGWLVAVFVIAADWQMAISYYIRSLGYTKMYALQGIVNTALTILFNILFLVVFDMGVTGFILAITAGNAIVAVWLFVQMKLWQDVDFRLISKKGTGELLRYSIPMIPTAVLWTVTSITDRLIVRTYSGDDINGLFVYAYKIPTLLTLITTVFVEAWQLSAVNDADDSDRGNYFTGVFRCYSGIIFMAATCLIAMSKIFARLLLADSYYGAWRYMPVLIAATVFSAFSTFVSTSYMVKKKSVVAFVTALTGAAVNVVLSWLLAIIRRPDGSYFGIYGVIAATLISYIVLFVMRVMTTGRYVDFGIGIGRTAVNTVMLTVQALIMTFEIRYWFVYQAAIALFLLAFNAKPIIDGLKPIIAGFIGKRKKTE